MAYLNLLIFSQIDSICSVQVECVSSIMPGNFAAIDSTVGLLLRTVESLARFLLRFGDNKNANKLLEGYRIPINLLHF